MDFYANVGCILSLDTNCETCKMKLHQVIGGVAGQYSIEIDSEQGLAKISGEMDPNIVLAALAKHGKHADLKWMKISSPAPPPPPRFRGHYNYGGSRHSYYPPPPPRTSYDYPYNYNAVNYGYQDNSYYNPGYYGYNGPYINY